MKVPHCYKLFVPVHIFREASLFVWQMWIDYLSVFGARQLDQSRDIGFQVVSNQTRPRI